MSDPRGDAFSFKMDMSDYIHGVWVGLDKPAGVFGMFSLYQFDGGWITEIRVNDMAEERCREGSFSVEEILKELTPVLTRLGKRFGGLEFIPFKCHPRHPSMRDKMTQLANTLDGRLISLDELSHPPGG